VFDDYFVAAYLSGGREDSQKVEHHFASLPWHSMRAGTERVWASELSRMWPAIEQVAEWLLVGEPVTDQRIRDLTDAENALT
jgi:lipopolysaccharide biosynthesis glycosyltransferase